jgi:hypothetical protein
VGEYEQYREWLIEQVAAYIAKRVDLGYDFAEVVRGARVSNEHEQWSFDGPLTFSDRELEPHEQESWTRYERQQLASTEFERAVSMARELL